MFAWVGLLEEVEGKKLKMRFSPSKTVENAEFIYTCSDCNQWAEKKWKSVDIMIESPNKIVMITSNGWKDAFVNITSERGLTVSTWIMHQKGI